MAQNTKSNKNKLSKQQQQTGKKSLQEKNAQQKKKQKDVKKCSCACKFIFGSILLIAVIAGLIAYDTEVNAKGVFAKSTVGKLLKDVGVLPHAEKAWYTSMSASARAYKWAEQHVPPYAKPVGKLACDLYKLTCNAACNTFSVAREFVNAKLPVAANFLEQYVPGLPKKIENASGSVKVIAVNGFTTVVTFFKTQIFVGNLSPENLNKVFNTTQNAALEYFYLFNKKVDAYAKLK